MSTHPPTLSKPPVAGSGTDHDALPPGTRFGEFEILRVLGVGGFGIVYLARDHSLEREVALKEYMPASLAARGAGPQITVRSSSFAETYAIGLRSFINEARLLARFDHPSLVKVYRFWEDNATAYMVMPFLQGVTLRDARRGMAHAPDEAWIRSVLSPILSALELLHREGVYHRDIAPDNILLPRDGPPVLLDFGAARRVISDRTQSLTAILKPSYAPIEQYAEMTQLRQGPWTDMYALGAVVHYLLYGVPPAPATARAVQDDGDAIESRFVPGVSPRFLETMSWMLAIRPNQRPQSGEQLRAVLDGHAEIPPRGRPGMTIPGALAPAATGPQIEQAADATRINTAYLPTHLPTARAAPGSDAKPTTFSPTTSMPTARAAPIEPATQRGVDARAPAAPAAAGQAGARPAPSTAPASTSAAKATATTGAAPAAKTPPSAGAAAMPPVNTGPASSPPKTGMAAAGPAGAAGANGTPARPAAAATAKSAPARPTPDRSAPAVTTGRQPSTHGREGPPSQPASWAASRPPDIASGRDGAVSQPASWAASRPATLPPGAAGAITPPPVTIPPAASRPAPLPTAPGPRAGRGSRTAVLAGAGLFVAIAAAAAWQFAAKRETAVNDAASAASAAGASIAATGATTLPASLPSAPIIIEKESDAKEIALPAREPTASASSATTPVVDPAQRQAVVDRNAPVVDGLAAAAARQHPPGKPVPRVDDPLTSGAPATPVRPYDSAPSSAAALNGDRQRVQPVPPPRDYAAPQRQVPSAVETPAYESVRDACRSESFFSRNICMDQKCDEPRFRTSPECVAVNDRKHRRQTQ